MTGIVSKWNQDATVDSAPCETAESIQGTKLSRAELRMTFLLMLFAYGSACGLLVLELVLAWLGRRYRYARWLTPQLAQHAQTISAVQRVVVRASSDPDVKRAWQVPAGRKTSVWTSSLAGSPLALRSKGGAPAAGGGWPLPVRTDREVVRDMRASIRRVNGRPYMFVRTSGRLQPVPVTQEKNDLLMNIFSQLKRQHRHHPPDG